MVREIVWTKKAKNELFEIFDYWNNRNQSKAFSLKLNTLVNEQLQLIVEFPKMGRKTDVPNVCVRIIHKYLLYYEIRGSVLYVLSVRHGSRNPKTLKLK